MTEVGAVLHCLPPSRFRAGRGSPRVDVFCSLWRCVSQGSDACVGQRRFGCPASSTGASRCSGTGVGGTVLALPSPSRLPDGGPSPPVQYTREKEHSQGLARSACRCAFRSCPAPPPGLLFQIECPWPPFPGSPSADARASVHRRGAHAAIDTHPTLHTYCATRGHRQGWVEAAASPARRLVP